MKSEEIAMNYSRTDRIQKLQEECDELSDAIELYASVDPGSAAEKRAWYHILEEIADVETLIDHVKVHLAREMNDDFQLINRFKDFKRERQSLRILMSDETWAGRKQAM